MQEPRWGRWARSTGIHHLKECDVTVWISTRCGTEMIIIIVFNLRKTYAKIKCQLTQEFRYHSHLSGPVRDQICMLLTVVACNWVKGLQSKKAGREVRTEVLNPMLAESLSEPYAIELKVMLAQGETDINVNQASVLLRSSTKRSVCTVCVHCV